MPNKKYVCGCGKCSSSSTYCPSSSSSSCPSSSSYSSSTVCSSSSSTYIKCKKKKSPKYCPNPYMRSNYEPCYPVPCAPCPPYPCAPNPCNPCAPCPPNPCNPCNPCTNPKTYNPFQYPNYTIYSSTSDITISSIASQSYYIYVSRPPSSSSLSVTLPLINSLDCSKKRNFVISNSGSAGSPVYIIPSASGATYDTINGQDVGSGGYELLSGCSVQVFADASSGAVPNWILIGCVI
jgi:hypothetical protein